MIVIDASLLGLIPFQAYIQDGIVSCSRINRILPELEGSEYYIFIPSQGGDPLAYEGYRSSMIIDHGDVIHLTPDPSPPQAVLDVQWAFDRFSDGYLTEFADGYDLPSGVTRILVLSEAENFLLEAVEGESDEVLTQRICDDLGIASLDASVVRPSEPFERPMYYQHFLSDIVFFLETPLGDSELVVFVDSRPVLQAFSAIRLQYPVVPVSSAIDRFKIRVEAIEGYRLWLKGGRRGQDCLLEAQEVEFASEYSSDESSAGSSDDDGLGQNPRSSDASSSGAQDGPQPCEGGTSQSDGAGSLGEERNASQHSSGFFRTEQEQRGTATWDRASGREALVEGKHGDTSGHASFDCSLHTSSSPTSTRRSSVRKVSTALGVRLWLFS